MIDFNSTLFEKDRIENIINDYCFNNWKKIKTSEITAKKIVEDLKVLLNGMQISVIPHYKKETALIVEKDGLTQSSVEVEHVKKLDITFVYEDEMEDNKLKGKNLEIKIDK